MIKIELEQLRKLHDLSQRSYNVCINSGLNNLELITGHFLKHLTFSNLKNCGRKSDEELTLLCEYYFENKISFTEVEKIQEFPNIDLEGLFSFIRIKASKLSKRSQNVVEQVIAGMVDNPSILFSFKAENNIKNLKNAGTQSVEELIPLFKEMIEFVQNGDKNRIALILKTAKLEYELHYYDSQISNWLKTNNLTADHVIPFLSFFQYHIENRIPSDHLEIIDSYFKLKEKNEATRLADKLNYSKERIRQLKNSTVLKIIKEAKNLKSVFKRLGISATNYFSEQTTLFSISKLILEENIYLPENIVFKILESVNVDIALIIDQPKKHQFKYLIPKHFKNNFDFTKFLKFIEEKHTSKIEVEYKIESPKLIEIFQLNPIDKSLLEDFESVLSKLLISEFGLAVINNRIVFKRNTKKKTYEYIVDILNLNGEPMHVNDILPLVNKSFPKKPKRAEGIRSHCINYPDIFINTAWSTYGLKKWETQGKQVGGTIKQVAIKYLQEFDVPKHIYEISSYVTKYRETNKLSVWGNINLDPKKVFIVFNGGFVGLSEKNYSKKDTLFNNVKPNWFRFLKSNFLVNGRSQYTMEILCIELAKSFRVQPIQIEALIAERIESEELVLDNESYIHLTKDDKPKFIESFLVKRSYLKDPSLTSIISALKKGEHLNALTICLEAFKDINIEISLKEAKRIVDFEYENLIT